MSVFCVVAVVVAVVVFVICSPSLRFANFQGRSGGKYTCRAKTSETCVKESGIFTLYSESYSMGIMFERLENLEDDYLIYS